MSATFDCDRGRELTDDEVEAILLEKRRAQQRSYYRQNIDARRAASRDYYHRNREAILARWRERYATDAEFREKHRERHR